MKHSSKRRFLKKIGLLTTCSFMYPALWACTPQKNSKKKGNTGSSEKLGVALVGLGYYSKDLLAPALRLTQYCELRGIVTGSPEKIPVWQKQYDIPDANVYNYENMHRIADNDDIDVVYIVVPTGLHMKYAVIASNTGKHVWCEKPMALDVSQCQKIIDACAKNKVKLSIGYRVQHEPNMQEVIRLTRERQFGDVSSLLAEAGYAGGTDDSWRFNKDLGGGALYDMGVYTINGLRHASQMEPVSVLSASHSTTRPEAFTEVDETTEYQLEFPNGVIAEGRTSVGQNDNRLEVNCAKGYYYLAPMQTYNGLRGKRSDGTEIYTPIQNQQALQMDNDALAIKNNRDVLVPGIDGLKDIHILNGIQRAASIGEIVNL